MNKSDKALLLITATSCLPHFRPIWEHEANAKGGKLEITWERRGNKPTDVDKLWLDTVRRNREIFFFLLQCEL